MDLNAGDKLTSFTKRTNTTSYAREAKANIFSVELLRKR
jgi:hypothetical protein